MDSKPLLELENILQAEVRCGLGKCLCAKPRRLPFLIIWSITVVFSRNYTRFDYRISWYLTLSNGFATSTLTGYTDLMASTQKDSKIAKTSQGIQSSVNGEQDVDRENDVGSQGGESLDLLMMAEKMIQSVSTPSAMYLEASSNF